MSTTTGTEAFSRYCRKLYERGLVHACAGNVSEKTHEGILITPKGWCLGDVRPDDAVMLRPDGSFLAEEGRQPSSEWRIHLKIFEARSDIGAVCHAHPPKATALTLAGVALDEDLFAEVILTLGRVPLVPFILPGSDELAERLKAEFQTHHGVLLSNHGVFTVGQTLKEAYFRMELIESLAETVIAARQLGRINPLTPEQVAAIKN